MNKLSQFLKSYQKLIGFAVLLALFYVLTHFNLLKWGTLKFEQESYITVTGSSQMQKKNEIATFNAGVTVTNMDKAIAVSEVNKKSQAVIDAVKNFGVKDEDVKTANLNIFQEQESYYDNGAQRYRPGQWRANVSVEIKLRDIARANDLTDMLAKLETTDLYGPNFALDASQTDETGLLADALKDAKTKADAMAASTGNSVGKVVSIVEGASAGNIIYPFKDAGMGGGGGAALEPGSSTVSKTVTVTYKLK